MKKYVCPMGCVEPQDQPGICLECGMKLLPADERRLQRGSTRMMGYADRRGSNTTQIDVDKNISENPRENNQRKSADENNISVHLREHQRKSAADVFLKKFWLSLILTLIVIFLTFYPYKSVLNPYLSVVLASIVFFYGGWVFIIGALREIKAKNPGMMTLIALAISSAYLYSLFVTISALIRVPIYPRLSAEGFWWELTSLITIMLLGHYFEMKSVSSAQRALKEIEKLLPDKAEVIAADESLSTRINDRIIIYPNINRIIISTRMTTGYSVKIRVINSV